MAISKLAARRLTKLADYMETVKNSRFDMREWVAHKGDSYRLDNHHSIKTASDIPMVMAECGMSACALGYAAMIPSFRRAGLTLELGGVGEAYPVTPSGRTGFNAASEFFNITHHQSEVLFDVDEIRTPKQWVMHCRKFLRDNA